MFVAQKAFIKRGNKVLVMRDPKYAINGDVGLDFPGGKYRWGESLEEELQREVIEETGLKIKIGKPFVTWTNYKLKTKGQHANVLSIGYLCEYVSGNVVLSDEHDMFEWVNKKSYKKWKENSGYFKALEEYFYIFSQLKS
jgi:8-oxo-dGTP diphosphatase